MKLSFPAICALIAASTFPARAGEISVERGRYLAVIGGCHDCHTEGYSEGDGKIDPQKALRGNHLGWQGPWGTTFPPNLLLTAKNLDQDGFANYLANLRSLPPMPSANVRQMSPDDLRSLYLYIRSLGEPGRQAPAFVPPGARVTFPYVVLDPPQMPPPCTRDLDCGVGDVCGKSEPRMCIPR